MRIFLSSLCAILFLGCASYPKKQGLVSSTQIANELMNPYFSDTSKDYVYKANIKAFGNRFGGILVIKKIGDVHHRIVFTTEMGNTIFDFEFQQENFKINRILAKMDKKVLKNMVKRDFLALIKEKSSVEKTYIKDNSTTLETELMSKKHFYEFEKGKLLKITRANGGNEKVTFRFSGINDNIATEIWILHQNVDFEIKLTAI